MNDSRSQAKQDNQLRVNKSLAPINCLVTGYDPFEDEAFNPSELIAQDMPAFVTLPATKTKIPLRSFVLPVCGKKAWPLMKSALDALKADGKPCVIVMMGLASMRKNICLERFALNIRDGNRKDNGGHLYSGQIIDTKAPEALRTNAPIEAVLKRLKTKGLPAEISNFCGAFVCNEIYFLAIDYLKKSRLPHLITFIHLPLPSNYGKILKQKGSKKLFPLSKGKKNQLAAMRSAVLTVVEFYGEFLIGAK